MMRMAWGLALVLALGMATVVVFAAGEDEERPSGGKALIPLFDGSGLPKFSVTYRNETERVVDLPTLLHESTITLDGREYRRGIVRFGGGSNLRPKGDWTFTLTTGEYLLGEKLKAGKHEISLGFGGQKFGPAEFVWQPPDREPPAQ